MLAVTSNYVCSLIHRGNTLYSSSFIATRQIYLSIYFNDEYRNNIFHLN